MKKKTLKETAKENDLPVKFVRGIKRGLKAAKEGRVSKFKWFESL